MLDALVKLFENESISEEVRAEIQEAWNAKVRENKMQVTAELREEFAQKYEHDKHAMVEAVDAMLEERLSAEIAEFADDRKQLAEAKAKYAVALRENTNLMKNFIFEQLNKEISELHNDQKAMAENFAKLEEFVVESLAKEIADFYEDKKDLAETKVRLVLEAKEQLAKVKQNFIEKSAKTVYETVTKVLSQEIGQLKEDIEEARKNDFGRLIFEAFAGEYVNSYLNEKSETSKLVKIITTKEKQLAEAKSSVAEITKLVESQEKEKKRLVEAAERKDIMYELVAPLSKDQRDIMTDLLESVQTAKLRTQFDKYLPAVIDGKPPATRKALKEGTEITGNRENTNSSQPVNDSNVIDLRRLAGLN